MMRAAPRPPATSRALCHDWLTTYGGADQVAARLGVVLDIKEIFTYAAWGRTVAELFPRASVRAIGPPAAEHRWRWFLPLMPRAWRSLDLSSYDVVVTSSHSCVNAVRPRADAVLVSYCHTPMRYAWEWRSELDRLPWPARPAWPLVASRLRAADRRWSQRVDLFMANSRFVAGRIASSYGKGSLVLYPPIDTTFWCPGPETDEVDGYFLLSGRMVAYKRPELVVEAANRAGVDLVVAGSGPMLADLRKRSSANVRFEVDPSRERLRALYRGARAFVFAGTEDFGMSVVEAQACGTPVIAFAAGGVLETVVDGTSGVLVETADEPSFARVMRSFNRSDYDSEQIREGALRFDAGRFDEAVAWAVGRALDRDWKALHDHPQWVGAKS